MKPICLALWATVVFAGFSPANAQITSDNLTLTLAGETPVGIDDCASDAADEFNLSGTFDGATSDYELRLTWSTTSSSCGRDVLESCPSEGGSGDQICGCLIEGTAETISKSTSLDELYDTVCSQEPNTETKVYFFLEYFNELADEEVRSTSVSIRVDFKRPAAPDTAPRVSGAENALVVKFDVSEEDDVQSHEVCVRAKSAAPIAAGEDPVAGAVESNDDLRDGFAAADCRRTSEGEVRVTGLENGAAYTVVYAAVDTSGNRGPNSPTADGAPAEVQDFAEVYVASKGTERGGCSATDAGGASFAALLIVLGALRRRRDRK